MLVHILGSAAGGGFPQWNCNCANCTGVRAGRFGPARTQSSIAVSDEGIDWILCNASPDIGTQLRHFAASQSARAPRDTGVAAVVLTDSQIDHTAGLLSLREGCPLPVWCTESVYEDLSTGFPVFPMLRHWNGGLRRQSMIPDRAFSIPACPGLRLHAVPLRSAAPPYSPHRGALHPDDTVGLRIEDRRTGGTLLYAPGIGAIDETLRQHMASADCLLLDGTFWHDDEMARCGAGTRNGHEMGHLALAGPAGLLETLEHLSRPRKVLTHINNTNPVLDAHSQAHAELRRRGIELAFDGMQIAL